MSRRWIVELPSGKSEDVGANIMEISGGALSFRHEGHLVIAYGPMAWTTVTEAGYE